MTNFTRRIALMAIAAASLASLPALAAEKVNLGVSIPAATHSFMGGINYWANQAKKDLEKQHKDLKITIKTASGEQFFCLRYPIIRILAPIGLASGEPPTRIEKSTFIRGQLPQGVRTAIKVQVNVVFDHDQAPRRTQRAPRR